MLYRKFLLASALLTCSSLIAAQGIPHTWHTISTTNGDWQARLQMINQGGSFVTREGDILTGFKINPQHSQHYGFIFDEGDDFNVAYTLTLTQEKKMNFSSKACVYVITASGPAQPDIRVSSFNGAKCEWRVVHGVGEDFVVG